MEIKQNFNQTKNVGFKGYNHKKSDSGKALYDFNFMYDSKYWDCSVEFFKVKQNKFDYSYSVVKNHGKMEPIFEKQLTANGASVNPEKDLKLQKDEAVAYRYKLTNKENNNVVKYAKDDDQSFVGEGCNLITRKGTTPFVQGSMYLQMEDSLNPKYTFAGFKENNTGELIEKADAKDFSKFNRTFSNKADGNLAGMTHLVKDLKAAGYKKSISLPSTGGDSKSSHKYWLQKMFQTENIDNYDTYQKELFKNGMGYVADGAFTSQGLEGANFQYAVKWMNQDDKPHEYYMFRMEGLQDAALGMGVVPKNMENLRHKVVNSPNDYIVKHDGQIEIKKNKNYDVSQPTYIQVFDNSMVSDEQRNDKTSIIDSYAKSNPTSKNSKGESIQNNLAINTHDDTLINNAFKIDYREYEANIKNLNIINKDRNLSDKIDLNSPQGTLVLSKFSGIEIRPKDEGGFVTWDANTDMAKLSYTESDYDTQILESIKNPRERAIEEKKIARGHAGNRDVLVDGMRYWTKHVREVQTEFVAQTLGELSTDSNEAEDRINSLIYNRKDQKLPDDVALSSEVVETVLDNDYNLRHKEENFDLVLTKSIMNYPLDSIEFANDAVGTLSSPYLSKRSPDVEHVGISRYDAMNDSSFIVPEKYESTYNKMNDVLNNQINKFATDVLHEVDLHADNKIFQNDGSKLSELGQYVVPMVAQDIVKYAVIKSLMPSAEMKLLKDGKMTYDYETLKSEGTLDAMGIKGDSPEDEANQLISKVKKGVSNFTSEDVSKVARSINKRIKNTNGLSYRMAEVMVDRSGLGLDWRIDAAKDIADMDTVRNMDDRSDVQFSEVINVWSPATAAIKEENPNSLILAEFTDLYDTMKATYGTHENIAAQNNPHSAARFKDAQNIVRTLIIESGMNTEANYGHFFTAGINTFGKDFVNQDGIDAGNDNTTEEKRVQLLSNALSAFADMPLDYKRNAYTFGGNHDKPRLAECFGLDMGLFHSNLNNNGNKHEINNRKTAYMIVNDLMFEDDLNKPNVEENGKTGWDIINNDKDYFNNISPMAVAKGNWLRSSIGLANRIITEKRLEGVTDESVRDEIKADSNKIYAGYSKAISDVVKGEYFLNDKNSNDSKLVPDSYKKQLEKDGFGSKDILTAFDIITEQAKENYDIENTNLTNDYANKEFSQLVEKIAVGIPAAKVRMYTQMLNALPGNPTTYAGDDFAMTGYEEKNHNVYLQNRNIVPWDTADKNSPKYKDFIAKHKEAMDGIVGTRRMDIDSKLAPLNNGTMFKLETLTGERVGGNGKNPAPKCPAILAQSSDGSMAISVFNFNGISIENPLTSGNVDINKIDEYLNPKPVGVKLDKIALQASKINTNLDLSEGLKFKNVDSSDPSYYETARDNDGNCFIQRVFEKNGKKSYEPVYITKETAPEGVLRLYYQPEDVQKSIAKKRELEEKYTPNQSLSFKGSREYFNPQYNIPVANTYKIQQEIKTGDNLSLVSK